MSTKKYVSLDKLSVFLRCLRNTFANITHKHTISDITDYTVDSELSSTSTNPVQNKAIDAEFDAISEAMGALELSIDKSIDNITSGSTAVAKAEEATHATSADSATSATSATKATQDASGNVITSTYETKEDAQTKYDAIADAKADSNHTHNIIVVSDAQPTNGAYLWFDTSE